jgi:hypothetical protein
MRRSLFLICGLLLTVCNVRAEEVTNTYSCRGFDSRSNLVVEGILNISVDTTNRVRGNWNLHNIELTPKIKSKVAHHVAWPVGSGKLEGQIEKDEIAINLNPNVADGGLLLSGKMTATNILGTLTFCGEGPQQIGKFEAIKKERTP